MGVYIALLCVGVLLVASYLFLRTKKSSLVAVFIKIGASLIFISICAYGLYLHHYTILPLMFVIGMVFGMLGDILLDLKYVFPEQDKMFTYSGFITFGYINTINNTYEIMNLSYTSFFRLFSAY